MSLRYIAKVCLAIPQQQRCQSKRQRRNSSGATLWQLFLERFPIDVIEVNKRRLHGWAACAIQHIGVDVEFFGELIKWGT